MAGVFLSYARFDSELGERIVAGLRALDVECWWDRDMPGVDWPREIERQIETMSALLVIWTAASKDSKYVRAEAIPAFDREKLVNIMVGVKEPPLPFNLYNGFQLDGWTGREPHEGWTRLVRTLEAKLVKAGDVKQGQLVTALGRREQGVRRRFTALTAAEEAFAAAKAADGEADAALAQVRSALTKAEEQLSQVSAMHAGPNVIRGAQADLDDAHNAVKAAETGRKTAAGELASASRALARAKTAVETAFVSPPELASEGSDAADGDASPADTPPPAQVEDAASDASAAPAKPPTSTPNPAAASTPAASVAAGGGASAAVAQATAGPGIGSPASASSPGAAGGAASLGSASGGAAPPKPSSPMPLLIGGAAVLVVGIIALALFSGHHQSTSANNADNAADNATNSTADNAAVASASAAPPAVDPSATLGDILGLIDTAVIAQGPVAFEGFAHDSDPPAGKQSDWTYTKRIEYTNFTPDVPGCQLNFHFKLFVNNEVSDDKDAGVPLRDVRTVKVAPEADLLQIRDAQSGHPTYTSRLQPAIYDVDLVRSDGGVNEFSFYSLDTAHRVGSLFEAAAQRCGVTTVSNY